MNKTSTIHTLEWDEFRTSIDKIKSIDDILLICKNVNVENLNTFEKLLVINDEKEKYISKIGDMYKKEEIIDTNKKFEIKDKEEIIDNNKKLEIKDKKEINIDVYYNNMNSIEIITNLSADEFKEFIEKGNTHEQNKNLLNLISKEIKECEKNINELNNKIIESTNEKDEKCKKWSYLYETYRKLIENVENKNENKNNSEEETVKIKKIIKKQEKDITINNILPEKIDNEKIDNEKIDNEKTDNKIIVNETIVNETIVNETILNEIPKQKVIKKSIKKNDIVQEESIKKSDITDEASIKNDIVEDAIKKEKKTIKKKFTFH